MACTRAGIGRRTYYEWRDADPEFAAQADEAIEDGTDILEDVLRSVAIGGNVKALLATLKARRRDKWGDKLEAQHTSKDGEPLTIRVLEVVAPAPREDA